MNIGSDTFCTPSSATSTKKRHKFNEWMTEKAKNDASTKRKPTIQDRQGGRETERKGGGGTQRGRRETEIGQP